MIQREEGTNVLCGYVEYTQSIEVRIFNPVYVFKKEILLLGLDFGV
ncbi:TPA: hypothetical protein QCW96_005495 [Bacillus pacificus]|nr:hypothetical protein [Bacillus pacificus]MCU5562680.1 hypothetical protein [Bacillus pacificus]HDR7256080.1 hypothetical protein [Bacillus pacificus]